MQLTHTAYLKVRRRKRGGFRYDAAHAFANERSDAYDVKAANQAWERMLPFLGKHL